MAANQGILLLSLAAVAGGVLLFLKSKESSKLLPTQPKPVPSTPGLGDWNITISEH